MGNSVVNLVGSVDINRHKVAANKILCFADTVSEPDAISHSGFDDIQQNFHRPCDMYPAIGKGIGVFATVFVN